MRAGKARVQIGRQIATPTKELCKYSPARSAGSLLDLQKRPLFTAIYSSSSFSHLSVSASAYAPLGRREEGSGKRHTKRRRRVRRQTGCFIIQPSWGHFKSKHIS